MGHELRAMWNIYGDKARETPYTIDNAISYLKYKQISEIAAKKWVERIDSSIQKSPIDILTMYDFNWWINFNFKWDAIYYRTVSRADRKLLANFSLDFLSKYVYHFFNTDDFQKWSMLNPHLKIGKTIPSYKYKAKEIIYEYTKDLDYFNNKTKIESAVILYLQRNPPIGITSEFEFIYDKNKLNEYYEPNNDWA